MILLLPTLLLAVLYLGLTSIRRKGLGIELHFGFLLALTVLAALSMYGMTTREPGMLGNVAALFWVLAGLVAATAAFAIGWSFGVLLLWHRQGERMQPGELATSKVSRWKFWFASSLLTIALLAVPLDYLLRHDTPRWVGTSSTGAQASQWIGLTMRALFPYDRGDRYIPLFSILLPPNDYRLLSINTRRPKRDRRGDLVFDFGADLPPLSVSSDYAVFELRGGAWVRYEGPMTDEQLQQFLRTARPSHSLEDLLLFVAEVPPSQDL